MTADEIKRSFTMKQMLAYNSEIRSKYNSLKFQYNQLNLK